MPALPAAWETGRATGLRARGNVFVDLEWQAGRVVRYRLASPTPRPVTVRVNGATQTVVPAPLTSDIDA